MKRYQYIHFVIAKYISVAATCIFAVENYTQQTFVDANKELRSQFEYLLNFYDKIYSEREEWSAAVEDLVDYKMVSCLENKATDAVNHFKEKMRSWIPAAGGTSFDINTEWMAIQKSGVSQSQAVISLVKEIRSWEENNLFAIAE